MAAVELQICQHDQRAGDAAAFKQPFTGNRSRPASAYGLFSGTISSGRPTGVKRPAGSPWRRTGPPASEPLAAAAVDLPPRGVGCLRPRAELKRRRESFDFEVVVEP